MGELLQPGQRLLVAKGGKGGAGVRAPSRERKQRDLARELKFARVRGEGRRLDWFGWGWLGWGWGVG